MLEMQALSRRLVFYVLSVFLTSPTFAQCGSLHAPTGFVDPLAGSIAVADFNHDGKPDLALTVNFSTGIGNDVYVLLGNGDGTFQSPMPLSTGGRQTSLVRVGDLNGDGWPDLVVASVDFATQHSMISVFLNNTPNTGSLSFNAPLNRDVDLGDFVLGDVDGDGKLDLVFYNLTIDILPGLGDGTFGTEVLTSAQITNFAAMALADMNGDGKLDVITLSSSGTGPNFDQNQLQIARNTTTAGAVSFASPVMFTTQNGLSDLLVADFNGDGKPDLALGNVTTGNVIVLLNNTPANAITPTFSGSASFASPLGTLGIGDFNGDGKPDIIGVDSNGVGGKILINNTATGAAGPSFTNGATFNATVEDSANPNLIAIGDFNQDGVTDLIVTDSKPSSSFKNLLVLPGLGGTTNTMVGRPAGANPGDTVNLSATIVAEPSLSSATPSGTVQFTDNGANLGSPQTLSETVAGTAVAGVGIAGWALGTHPLRAIYSGDANFCPSISPVFNESINNKNKSATAITSSLNPSIFSQSVKFTATVSSTAPGTPTGTVTFMDGTAALGTGNVNGNGIATFTTSSLSINTHSITAVYGGDLNFNDSTSPVLLQVVNPKPTAVALVSSLNPSVSLQNVTFTANVTSTFAGTPTGTVTFMDQGSIVLSTSPLDGNAQATYSTSALSTSIHHIAAAYNGDAVFVNSTSNVIVQTVNPKGTTTTALAANPNPSFNGQSVTFTATVSSSAGTPTGTVTFIEGTTTLATGSLNNGIATFSTAALSAGSHSITAAYGGSAVMNSSTSAAFVQNVQDFTLTANPTTLNLRAGQSGMVTITLTPQGGFNGTVTLSCGNLPQLVTCSFNPATLASNGGPVSSVLTVSTSGPNAFLGEPKGLRPDKTARGIYAWLNFSGGALAMIWLTTSKRKKILKGCRGIRMLFVGALLLAFVIAGCGGGDSPMNNHNNPVTPPGTTSVSVTAAATGSATHNLNLTITVTP